MMNRPFRILGVQQIAIGGASKQRLRSLWVDVLGLEVKSTFRSERENVDEDICFIHPKGNEAFPLGGEGVLIELVQAPPAVIAAAAGLKEVLPPP